MASLNIHLAIAKKYLVNHPNINYNEFINGTIYPDMDDKDITHHEIKNKVYKNKTNLYLFIISHPDMNDFELGWFLHLVCDYLFFKECFTIDLIDLPNFKDKLYYSYYCSNNYVWKKYNLSTDDFKEYPQALYPGAKQFKKCLLTKKIIDDFINRVVFIDLEEYKNKILKNRKNIEP